MCASMISALEKWRQGPFNGTVWKAAAPSSFSR